MDFMTESSGHVARRVMYTVDEVAGRIGRGERLILAADARVLDKLPAGDWIAGTIPYFMSERGGLYSKEMILVTELPKESVSSEIKVYDTASVDRVYLDAPKNGISVIIMPASSRTHFAFALGVTMYEGFATKPLIGWVSGTEIGGKDREKAMVYCGAGPRAMSEGAVVMHIALAPHKRAEINIVNIFRQDSGDSLMFLEEGCRATEVLVNGKVVNFAEYIERKGVDIRFPLVADYFGSMINISFKWVDFTKGKVAFYAPVFKGVEYKLAAPIDDYVALFERNMPAEPIDRIFFSCNCFLNYLYSKLEGKRTGDITGPITFGEIAYQLLNQTLVYAVIREAT